MDYIQWSDNLSVGVQVFDEEHKNLVGFVNRLNNALTIGSAKKTMEEILSSLIRYTIIHFKHEEDYMALHGYPALEKHRAEHEALKAQVADFHERFVAGKTTFSLELMTFLRDWLTNHILGSDMAYRGFFNERGVQ
ncbi:MAG TPA: bacteriohemerythrin [Spirochaetota bacterium]|nr:bacteriohemerythrin [Spirochaetota bacterium]HNT11159.1 bacteriohemerythrin [Spirochaetota bacterium]HNV46074.1 bacteriohemerythrin [Spirochaetota bacterium]HPI23813.1 bacteriohemerythrin [Spirochaetota bacterium]HPU87338.1 bacteriohemerythrin [Spirochaetota bacterium]